MHTVTPLYGHVISSALNVDRSLFAIMLFIISPPFIFNLTGVLLQDYEKQVKLLSWFKKALPEGRARELAVLYILQL